MGLACFNCLLVFAVIATKVARVNSVVGEPQHTVPPQFREVARVGEQDVGKF